MSLFTVEYISVFCEERGEQPVGGDIGTSEGCSKGKK